MIELMKKINLTVTQWLLVTMAATIGVLGIILRWKQNQIDMMKLTYLQEHFNIEQTKMTKAYEVSNKALKASKEKLNEAIQSYNNKHVSFEYGSNDNGDEPKS